MHLPIPIRNPAYVRVFPVLRDPSVSRTTDDISVVHAALDGRFSRRDEASWIPTPGQILRFRMKRFFDVDLFEYSVTVESSDSTVDGS
ncbi:MAG TPA: hypothetical protein PK765_07820 [bacterium]|nr:hypothetical protein [bacterium]HRI36898.1 hypothetical protein [bacterium]